MGCMMLLGADASFMEVPTKSNQINISSSVDRASSSSDLPYNLGTADIKSMGRGRGRGKKLTIVRSHEDKGSSGEEVVPARKRRGRPQKRFADKIDQTDVENFVEKVDGDGEEVDDVKLKNSTSSVGNKRGRPLKEGSNLVLEENNSSVRSSSDESTRTNGFRQIGSRRKNKPRRAAEAGLECK